MSGSRSLSSCAVVLCMLAAPPESAARGSPAAAAPPDGSCSSRCDDLVYWPGTLRLGKGPRLAADGLRREAALADASTLGLTLPDRGACDATVWIKGEWSSTGQVASACSSAVFGAEESGRDEGKPVTERREIPTDVAEPPYVVHVRNGDPDGSHRFGDDEVRLNGRVPQSPADVTKQVERYGISGEKGDAGDEGDAVPLRLAWVDIQASVPFAYVAAGREVRRLLADIGVRVQLRRGRQGDVSGDEIHVVLLGERPASPTLSNRTMGATVKDRTVKTVWVFVPNVAWSLRIPEEPPWTLCQRRELSQALGRVITHELVHVLAPDCPHSTGLMSAVLARDTLLRAGLRLDRSLATQFRAALTPAGRAAEPTATGTALAGAGRF
jgi:hypothetical protein